MQRFSRVDCAGAEVVQSKCRGGVEVLQRCSKVQIWRCRGSDEVIVQVIVQVQRWCRGKSSA